MEQLWNNLLKSVPIRLFCSYQIDVFGPDFDPELLAAVLSAHHELLPFDSTKALSVALARAAGDVPTTEALLLFLRKAFPDHADEILKLALEHYASAS